jgi:antirestriction protein ArdC
MLTHADIRYRGGRAYYAQEADYIQVPPIESFRDAGSFYATLAHETTHWTKHPSRIERDFGRKAWGDEGYAREELVAELGAAFLCADLELTPEVRDDHASYHRDLAHRSEERQPGDLPGRRPRSARRRIPAQAPAGTHGGRRLGGLFGAP